VIAVKGLSLRQGSFALNGISLTVPAGKYGVLMGMTGCGKTTILEAIAGLRPMTAGSITLGSVDATQLPPAARGIGYVPQDAGLFPTMTIRQHLAFALMIRRVASNVIDQRVEELSGWLGIRHLLDRRPAGLSGGEAQRVALGRALSFNPGYLLMDEPLSSLDESTRGSLVELLRDLRQNAAVTVLHVTHSRPEAEQLADVLFRLEDGCVREVQ
jgi:ABC-type sugar transport system ATPase subunit